jgi:hypothetical protein
MQAVVGNAIYSQGMGGLGDSQRKIRHYPTPRIRNKFDMNGALRSPVPRTGLWLTDPGAAVAVRFSDLQSASTPIALRFFDDKWAFSPATSDGARIGEPMGAPVTLRASSGVLLRALVSLPWQ